MRLFTLVGAVVGLLCLTPLAVAQPKTDGSSNVRKSAELTAGSFSFTGVVEQIDEQGIVLRYWEVRVKKDVTITFRPVDRLAEGKLVQGASGWLSYRWQDVKKGDRITLDGKYDRDEERWYCVALCIRKRPGEKLPESQDPKNDTRYRTDSFLNDIDNGEDKTEKEVVELFPPEIDRWTGGMIKPTTFPAEYRAKLNIIRDKKDTEREKKEQELKATPPKKDDKK